MRRNGKKAAATTRDPDRTRGRILAAAIAEFSAKGLAGARVDAIARRARTNKRMLYHYFGDKEGLFRAVLRWKISERRALFEAAPGDPAENLPFRFAMMCRDPDWIRLLGWESLNYHGGKVEEGKFRRRGIVRALDEVREAQLQGWLAPDLDARHFLLAKMSLAMFPAAFPQLTRLITGQAVGKPKFRREYSVFLKRIANVFKPDGKPGTSFSATLKTIFFIPAVGAALLMAGGCSQKPAPKTAPAVPVLTATASVTNVPVLIEPEPVGHVMPISSVTIRPQIGGVIRSVNFEEGQSVKKGDLLFTIDPRPAQAALGQAKANLQRDAAQLENSKIQFNREQKLFDQKLVSQDEYETSKAGFETLAGTMAADRAAVTNAELNLEYTSIRSPIDGRTGSLQFHEGNVVKSPDDVLLTINRLHPIYVMFAVPEAYLPTIQRQRRAKPLAVTAEVDNLPGEPPRGELTFVDNTVDATTGTIALKATFPNSRELLWPGQFVKISIQLDELTNAVVVPSQAVQVGQDGQFIFVVKPDNEVETRTVKTGVSHESLTVITSGVNAGETVVTDGQLRLVSGSTVSAKTK